MTLPRRALQTNARLAIVEGTIREKGWSEAICQELMVKTGSTRPTIYKDKDKVARRLAEEEMASLPERRSLFLSGLRNLQKAAIGDRAYSPASRLMEMEAKILGLDRVPLPEVQADDGPVDTSLESVLTEVRKMRKQAQAGHSYVAADKLLEREHAIIESIRLRDEAKAAQEMAHLDEEALVDLVVQTAASLPESLKAKLRSALGD